MNFEYFIKSGKVQKGAKDHQKAKALTKMSKNNFKTLKTIEINQSSASLVFSSAYESLRQILEAIALTKGLKVYSHQAFTYFLLELGEESVSVMFDRFRKLRNGINYYGKGVSEAVTRQAIKEIEKKMRYLVTKYLSRSQP